MIAGMKKSPRALSVKLQKVALNSWTCRVGTGRTGTTWATGEWHGSRARRVRAHRARLPAGQLGGRADAAPPRYCGTRQPAPAPTTTHPPPHRDPRTLPHHPHARRIPTAATRPAAQTPELRTKGSGLNTLTLQQSAPHVALRNGAVPLKSFNF